MNEFEFKWLTSPLAGILTGKGVFICCIILTLIFLIFYRKNKSRQLLNSLPGLFTSLGLLGTFVAICNSLGDINEDNLEIDIIIRDLVPAFTSSIAGLISAFLATIGTKIWYSYEDKKLEESVRSKSPEECLYELTNQMNAVNAELYNISSLLNRQEENNKIFNEQLNSTISQQSSILEKFVNDFVKSMDDIFIKMHGQIEQNIRDFGEEQFRKCANTLETLASKMTDLSQGLLDEQKMNVRHMIDGTNVELKQFSGNVTEQINLLCNQMSSSLTILNNTQDERLNTIINNYTSFSECLAGQNSVFAEKMNIQMNAEYEKMQQRSMDNLQQMADLKDAYQAVNEKMLQSATNMNNQVSTELRNSLNNFVADLQNSVSSEVVVLSNAIATNVKTLEKSYHFISDHVAHIKGNYESAAQAFEDAVNNAHRMNESQEKGLETVMISMQQVVKTNEKVGEVIEVLEERQERIESLISHINEISTTIELLQKLENQLNRIANK